ADIDRVSQDPSIVRHRGKVSAAVRMAQIFLDIQQEFGSFHNYLYSFMPGGKPIVNTLSSMQAAAVTSPESYAISKDLNMMGVYFFGSTICYAYMHVVGLVNDPLYYCCFK